MSKQQQQQQQFPAACPKWQLHDNFTVIAHSWESPDEQRGTYVVAGPAIVALQTHRLTAGQREDTLVATNILPCLLEQSPAIAACAGPRCKMPRYTSSLSTALQLRDLITFFAGTLRQGYKPGEGNEYADQKLYTALNTEKETFDTDKENWTRSIAQWHMGNAATTTPEAWLAFMEQSTLEYIHVHESAVMRMLWVMSKRDPSTLSLGRFLTRNVVFPDASVAFPTPAAYNMHVLDAARFFARKQKLLHVICLENSTLYKAEDNTFFPPEEEIAKRPVGYANLVAFQTLNEYFAYLCSPISKWQLL